MNESSDKLSNGQGLVLVECASCKQPGFMDVWPRIISSRDERAKELLLQGKLFKYICPVCNATTAMAYDCLYRDVEHRTLLLYATDRNSEAAHRAFLDQQVEQLQLEDEPGAPPYQRRLTFTTFEFCEKARLLDEGYDDRVIELMKVAIKRGMLIEGIIGARDIMIYERTLDDGRVSFIVSGEIPGDTVGVPQGYTYLQKQWTSALDELTDEYRFDAAWANAFLP